MRPAISRATSGADSQATSRTAGTTSSREIAEDDPVIQKRCALARKGGKLDLCKLGIKIVPSMAVDSVLAEYVRVAWLYDNEISVLPPGIGLWKVCSQLRLSDNRIRVLPPEIGKLRCMGMLHVDNNRLEALPLELAKCVSLNYLDFKNNRVTRIPVQLGVLPKLKDIEYELNPLIFPHKNVLAQGKASVVKYLKRYTEELKTGHLNLTRVGLAEIPSEIGYVGASLTSLDASDILPGDGMVLPFELGGCPNLVKCLLHPQLKILSPPEGTVKQGIETIVAYLSRFNDAMQGGTLDLRSMALDSFPQELNDEKHMRPDKIQRFLLSNNMIEVLPHQVGSLINLEELDASKNKLKILPAAMKQLAQLKILDVSDNDLLEVQEILVQMRSLQVLTACRNGITKISENLIQMRELCIFNVGYNQILKLPKAMGQWSTLREMVLESNHLTEFPADLCNLSLLQVRAHSNVSNENISMFPCLISKSVSVVQLDIFSPAPCHPTPPILLSGPILRFWATLTKTPAHDSHKKNLRGIFFLVICRVFGKSSLPKCGLQVDGGRSEFPPSTNCELYENEL